MHLDRGGLTPAMLRDGARRVMRDVSYQERMAVFREKSQAAGGNAAIAEAILTELRRMEEGK